MYSQFETLRVGTAKVVSSYRVMPDHHTPRVHKRDSTGMAPLISNFGTRQSGQFPALAPFPQKKEPLLPNEWEDGWGPELALIYWRREIPLTPAANQTLDHSACSLVTILTKLFQLLGYTSPGAIAHACLGLPTSVQLPWGFITQ
jgi:hypothetical protein